MRINIEINDELLAEARRVSGLATKKQVVEQALCLMVKLHRQREVAAASGKYPWRANLARSRMRRGTA